MSGFGKTVKEQQHCPLCNKALQKGTYADHILICHNKAKAQATEDTSKKYKALEAEARKEHWADALGLRKHGHESCKVCDALDQLK